MLHQTTYSKHSGVGQRICLYIINLQFSPRQFQKGTAPYLPFDLENSTTIFAPHLNNCERIIFLQLRKIVPLNAFCIKNLLR